MTYEVLTILEPASDRDGAGAEAFFRFLDELEAEAYTADDVTTAIKIKCFYSTIVLTSIYVTLKIILNALFYHKLFVE